MDDDVGFDKLDQAKSEDERNDPDDEFGEDAPIVVGRIVKEKEVNYQKDFKWKTITIDDDDDDSGNKRRASDSDNSDQSPRRRNRHDSDSDQSPPRRRRNDSDSDQSPPRRGRHDSNSDLSPPRKSRHDSDSDQSPPRKKRHDSDSDQSPPRRRSRGSSRSQSHSMPVIKKVCFLISSYTHVPLERKDVLYNQIIYHNCLLGEARCEDQARAG